MTMDWHKLYETTQNKKYKIGFEYKKAKQIVSQIEPSLHMVPVIRTKGYYKWEWR